MMFTGFQLLSPPIGLSILSAFFLELYVSLTRWRIIERRSWSIAPTAGTGRHNWRLCRSFYSIRTIGLCVGSRFLLRRSGLVSGTSSLKELAMGMTGIPMLTAPRFSSNLSIACGKLPASSPTLSNSMNTSSSRYWTIYIRASLARSCAIRELADCCICLHLLTYCFRFSGSSNAFEKRSNSRLYPYGRLSIAMQKSSLIRFIAHPTVSNTSSSLLLACDSCVCGPLIFADGILEFVPKNR